jgi:hydroxypyruvate reductase
MYAAAARRLPRGAPALVVLPRGYSRLALAPQPAVALELALAPEAALPPEVLFASHPEPDRTSVAAARRALQWFRQFGREDTILCLVSGGASSLLCLPRKGLSLAEKRARVRTLSRSGASILELNRLRTRLSAVKGGRLGRATEARLVTLVLSDVAGDDPAVVGSGPTIRGRRASRDVVRVVGSNATGLAAAAAAARARGFVPVRMRRRMEGEAAREGRRIARRALALAKGEVLLAGGETTVRLAEAARRPRPGGRSLEVAAAAAAVLAGSDVWLLAAASDGVDGTSRAAGALVDGGSARRAEASGTGLARALAIHATEELFEPTAAGGLFAPGPTGTNVCDWVFALRQARRPV